MTIKKKMEKRVFILHYDLKILPLIAESDWNKNGVINGPILIYRGRWKHGACPGFGTITEARDYKRIIMAIKAAETTEETKKS